MSEWRRKLDGKLIPGCLAAVAVALISVPPFYLHADIVEVRRQTLQLTENQASLEAGTTAHWGEVCRRLSTIEADVHAVYKFLLTPKE